MRAVDTNVLLRLMVTSDADQSRRAQTIASQPMFVPLTVLLETAWVLGSVYRLDRIRVAKTMLDLIALPTIVIDDEAAIRWALERVATASADLADMLHLVSARRAERFATFDRKLARQAGPEAPVTIETLA